MPNTLIHIAIQAPLSRKLLPKSPLPWILVGTIIPDIPWIIQRIGKAAIDPYQLRLYVTAQASLFFCLLLSLALAGFSRKPKQIFLLLAANSLAHLLLDSLQTKWANGVHLLAPFSWHLTSFHFFWPENRYVAIASVAGLVVLLALLPTLRREPLELHLHWRLILPSLLLYLLLPFAVFPQLRASNPSYLATLQDSFNRTGKYIEVDRNLYDREAGTMRMFTGEKIAISGKLPEHSGIVSIKGTFVSPTAIKATESHLHSNARDLASVIALALILLIWIHSLFHLIRTKPTGTSL